VLVDIGSVLGGLGLAVVAFVVVILVCVIILRLLAVILPPYQGPYGQAGTPENPAVDEVTDPDAPAPETEVTKTPAPPIEAAAPDPARDQEG
jgi:hypothetical protein